MPVNIEALQGLFAERQSETPFDVPSFIYNGQPLSENPTIKQSLDTFSPAQLHAYGSLLQNIEQGTIESDAQARATLLKKAVEYASAYVELANTGAVNEKGERFVSCSVDKSVVTALIAGKHAPHVTQLDLQTNHVRCDCPMFLGGTEKFPEPAVCSHAMTAWILGHAEAAANPTE